MWDFKKIALISTPIVVVLGLFIFYFANLKTVDAVSEGVLIRTPYIFGKDGVDPTPLYTGRCFIWPSDSLVMYSAVPQTVEEKFDDLPSSNNVQMDFRIHTTFVLKKGAAPKTHDNV